MRKHETHQATKAEGSRDSKGARPLAPAEQAAPGRVAEGIREAVFTKHKDTGNI